ncbi:MAG: hypothetical protein WCS52_18890 [bacterium]
MHTKRYMIKTVSVVLLLATGLAVRTLADDAFAVDRFRGGGRDGYDADILAQIDQLNQKAILGRFSGGGRDGWADGMATGLEIPVRRGTLLIIL